MAQVQKKKSDEQLQAKPEREFGFFEFMRSLKKEEVKEAVKPKSLFGMFRDWRDYREQRAQKFMTYEAVIGGGKATREFYVLLVLSCLIATMGLYQDSAAVIIGAMIVAPLMAPILAFSAGLFSFKGRVIGYSAFTLAKGLGIVLGITVLLTELVPYVRLTPEILRRTSPGLADIVVALACGAVGAYAYANTRISSALPGVAISVALMPPLCTVGISIGLGRFDLAGGAALLLASNLVGISLASAIVFYIIKLSPEAENAEAGRVARKRLLQHVAVSVVLLTAIAVPLVVFAINTIETDSRKERLSEAVRQAFPAAKVHEVTITGDQELHAEVIIKGRDDLRAVVPLKEIERRVAASFGRPVVISVYLWKQLGAE